MWAHRRNELRQSHDQIVMEYTGSSPHETGGQRIFRIVTSILIKRVSHVNNRHGKGKITI